MKEFNTTTIYNQNEGDKDDEILLIYNNKLNKKEINIFGDIFVQNNKNICKIVYKNKEYELKTKFTTQNLNNNEFEIKLIGVNKIIDMSYMFENTSIKKISDNSKMNTINVIDMSYMFYNCELLCTLPDFSKWNISNVKSINKIFCGCKSLKFIPDISLWNISNLKDISYLFANCLHY